METNFTNIKERILYYTDIKGLAKEKFFDSLGVTYGNFKGKAKEKSLSSDVLAKIVTENPEINPEWLLTGKGEMLKSQHLQLSDTNQMGKIVSPAVITVDNNQRENIVLVPQAVQAGYMAGGFAEPHFMKKLPAYRMPGLSNGIFRMFEVKGNSMFPTIPAKSFVVGQYIENWVRDIKDNQIYVVISNEIDDGIIKRCINRISKYNNLLCKSDNRRDYPSQNINPESIKEVWEVKLHLNFTLPDPADLYDRMNDLEAEMAELRRLIK